MTDEEREERRRAAAEAADSRSKDFKQGGGGDALKAKAKRQEQARVESASRGSNHPGMNWSVG